MNKPLVGPTKTAQPLEEKFYNHALGHVEKMSMNQLTFDQQYLTFHNFGYAANPAKDARGKETLVSTEAKPQHGRSIWDKAPTPAQAAKRRRLEAAVAGEEALAGGQSDASGNEGAGDDETAKW